MLLVTNTLQSVHTAAQSLKRAIDRLTAKINRTKVKFTKNDDGEITAFSLVGGIGKAEASGLVNTFARGGIATRATAGVFGEAGPEAIIPLDRINDLIGGGETNITNNITVNVEGVADDTSAEGIAERISEILSENVRTKTQTLRR